ncbi:MAG: hypothetical protein ABI277_00830 [Burkholderiaceae bacterium]
MNHRRKSACQRMVIVGMVGVVALIGNLRASGSQTSVVESSVLTVSLDSTARAVNGRRTSPPATVGIHAQDDATSISIPGIYAWDPDVRFVYFRHVSKWM